MSWLVASALGLSLQLMLPALIGALVGGLLVGIFQTATQISDSVASRIFQTSRNALEIRSLNCSESMPVSMS